MLVSLLMATALFASDQDGVVATAPATPVDLTATLRPVAPTVEGATQAATPHGLTTDQQIERWLSDRDPAAVPYADGRPSMSDDREMHGEFSASVGTGGYRDYGAAVSLPIGDNGRLDISIRQVENAPYGYGYGYGYGFEGPAYYEAGHAFPGREYPGQAAEFEARAMRPGGPPKPWTDLYPQVRSRD
jgi:hypothetical protein